MNPRLHNKQKPRTQVIPLGSTNRTLPRLEMHSQPNNPSNKMLLIYDLQPTQKTPTFGFRSSKCSKVPFHTCKTRESWTLSLRCHNYHNQIVKDHPAKQHIRCPRPASSTAVEFQPVERPDEERDCGPTALTQADPASDTSSPAKP
jgi:hypothetical protein